MANIIGVQEINNGPRHYFIRVDIEGDGSGDETQFELVDVDLINCKEVRLDKAWASFTGFFGHLEWDGATKIPFLQIPDGEPIDPSWIPEGGLPNPKVANYTGNVNFVTDGLGAGELGTMTLHFIKKGVEDYQFAY